MVGLLSEKTPFKIRRNRLAGKGVITLPSILSNAIKMQATSNGGRIRFF